MFGYYNYLNTPPTITPHKPSGFARSFGMRLANGERREWIKPIMFSGGLGSIEDIHVKKVEPEPGNTFTLCLSCAHSLLRLYFQKY